MAALHKCSRFTCEGSAGNVVSIISTSIDWISDDVHKKKKRIHILFYLCNINKDELTPMLLPLDSRIISLLQYG